MVGSAKAIPIYTNQPNPCAVKK